jgi:hypothetical protein
MVPCVRRKAAHPFFRNGGTFHRTLALEYQPGLTVSRSKRQAVEHMQVAAGFNLSGAMTSGELAMQAAQECLASSASWMLKHSHRTFDGRDGVMDGGRHGGAARSVQEPTAAAAERAAR